MQNAPSINLKKFECRLVNSFGDGHNHELAQYESFAASMQRIASSKGIDGILLGNVVCDNVSLDALLLTSFGVFIIEFKNYKGVDRIRITGQKEFQCLKSNGERMTLIDGSFLNVKGGSLASPYEQAKKNRIAVCNTLKRVFGDGNARKIHVGVAIVFNGQMAIEGIDRIIESERRWLTVVDSKGFEQFMSYVADERTVGLDASERETIIRHMDANGCVLEKANVFQQSQEFYKLGKYIEAYEKAMLCDPLNPEVVALKLASLYNIRDNKKYSRLFNELCVEHLNSAHPMVREAANKFMGLSFFIGRHGNHGEKKALEYLERSGAKEEAEVIDLIRANLARAEAQRQDQQRKDDYEAKKRMVVKQAATDYQIYGRIVTTSLILIATFFSIAILLPSDTAVGWFILAICCPLASIGGIIYWVRENESTDVWFIRKKAFEHARGLSFRTVSIESRSFGKGDRLYKTVFLLGAIIVYFGLPMYLCVRILTVISEYLMSADFMRNAMTWVVSYTLFNPLKLFLGFLHVYFILNACAIAYAVYSQFFEGYRFFGTVYDGKKDCYLIAIPDMTRDLKDKMESSIVVMCREGVVFSVNCTVLISILIAVKPFLYTLFSILF